MLDRVGDSESQEVVDHKKEVKKERSKAKKAVKKLLEAQNQDYDTWLHEQHLSYLEKIKNAINDMDTVLK